MPRSNILLGSILAGAAGIGFAANSTAAKLAYEGGTNPLTFLTLRSTLAALLVLAIVLLTQRSLYMPFRRRLAAFGIGVILATYSYGVLAAIQYIPVALAILIFYTFPLLTAAYTWISGRERPTILSVGALLVAFLGLALALDIGSGGMNPLGIALAAGAALGVTIVILLNNRLVGNADSYPVTLHMMFSAAALCALVTVMLGDFTLPQTRMGWVSLGIGTASYAAAITTVFIAVSLAGPVPVTLSMNLEPVASMALGFIVLGQLLSGVQLLGAGLVIASVLSVRLADIRKTGQQQFPDRR